MWQQIEFTPEDRIAIIAPHPDDECLGASAALLLAADRTDVFVMTDGSHGNPEKTIEEEKVLRKRQLEAEMDYVRPHSWNWLGYEDTKLIEYQKAAGECFSYEVNAPFYRPTHYVDITGLEKEKRRLIRFHVDQQEQEQITLSLNEYRGSQLFRYEDIRFAECYIKIDAYDFSEAPDLLIKLYEINDDPKILERIAEQGIRIKRVMPIPNSAGSYSDML